MRHLLCCLLLVLASPAWAASPCSSSSVQTLSTQLAAELANTLQVRLDRTRPIACTSFANLHNLEQSSAIGRVLGELSSNAFASYGYTMIEARLRINSVTIRDGVGELALSRSLEAIPGQIPAQAVLTGNYAQVGNALHVSARLIDAINHTVLATASCRLHLNLDTQALLTPDSATPPPPAQPTPKMVPLLNPHAKADARIMQQHLAALGLYSGKIDGVWGRKSKAALETFRKVQRLPQGNAWDEATQRALLGTP